MSPRRLALYLVLFATFATAMCAMASAAGLMNGNSELLWKFAGGCAALSVIAFWVLD